jgi:hypothetical protein
MAGGQEFQRRGSMARQRRLSQQFKGHAWVAPPSDVRASFIEHIVQACAETNRPKNIYAGISILFSDQHASVIAISIRDTTYLLDFIEKVFDHGMQPSAEETTEFVITRLRAYGEKHLEKVIGAAMGEHVAHRCLKLCSRLWAELDIIPLVLPQSTSLDRYTARETGPGQSFAWDTRTIDEQAEAMSRKCVR